MALTEEQKREWVKRVVPGSGGVLRPVQEELLHAINTGKDVLGIAPTGVGKTAVAVLAGVYHAGGPPVGHARTRVVFFVAPTRVLADSVASVIAKTGLTTVSLVPKSDTQPELAADDASGDDDFRRIKAAAALLKPAQQQQQAPTPPRIVFVVCTPEKFERLSLRQVVAEFDVPFVLVDECHAVVEWGLTFRPSYVALGRQLRGKLNAPMIKVPVVAVTGTLPAKYQAFLRTALFRDNRPLVLVASHVVRQELFIDVRPIEITECA